MSTDTNDDDMKQFDEEETTQVIPWETMQDLVFSPPKPETLSSRARTVRMKPVLRRESDG